MTPDLEPMRDAVLRAAALRGPFEPKALLKEVLGTQYADKVLRVRLLSALREFCTIERGAEPARWLLRAAPRQRALADFDSAAAAPQSEIAAALSGTGEYAPEALDQMIDGAPEEAALSQAMVTLERAGQNAPGHEQLFALRGRLNTLRERRRSEEILDGHFVGRKQEIGKIETWLAAPQRSAPLKSLHIQGLPGIGKSFLMERITQIARKTDDILLVRLDFDRPALMTGERGTIFDEISRQIGDALPRRAAELRALRLDHARRLTHNVHETSDGTPRTLLHRMVDVVAEAGHRLVFLLDTLEVLQAQNASYVRLLMRDLDRFAEGGRIGIVVISAGRGAIFGEKDERLGELIPLKTLEDAIICELLQNRGIAEAAWPRIIELAHGNPLRLRLLISAVEHAAPGEEAEALDLVERTELDTGYVHRAIRSRVAPELQKIAELALILPELSAETLVEVLGPALALGQIGGQAAGIIEDLGKQEWLFHTAGPGHLLPDGEIRREVLEHIYSQNPRDAETVGRRALDHYSGRDPVLQLYYALQLTRAGDAAPSVDPALAERFPDKLLRELPIAARDLVRFARGQRSTVVETVATADAETETMRAYRGPDLAAPDEGMQDWLVQIDRRSATGRAKIVKGRGYAATPDPRALKDLRVMLEQGERREATTIAREGLVGAFDPASEAGALILSHQWLTGHWSKAREIFALLDDARITEMAERGPQLEGRVALEIFAEFQFGKLVDRLQDGSFRKLVVHVQGTSTRIGLRAAALDFALMAAGAEFETMSEPLGVLAPYLEKAPIELAYERLRHAGSIRADLGIDFGTVELPNGAPEDGRYALAIAATNPYFDRLFGLIAEMENAGSGRLLEDLVALGAAIPEAAALFAPGQDGVERAIARAGQRPLDVLALIRGLGLLSDWADGYSFFHPMADLPTLARALSRWQQTSAGAWAYDSAPPPGWTSVRDWSAVTEMRLMALLGDDAPRRAARMLRFWADPRGRQPEAGNAMIERRLARDYAALGPVDDLEAGLRALRKTNDPEAFTAPLLALARAGLPLDVAIRLQGMPQASA